LDEVIKTLELMVNIMGDTKSSANVYLGTFLRQRFERTGSMDDLDRAINITRNAVDATTYDDPLYAKNLFSLAAMLSVRFKHTGSIDDLNQAISLSNNAIDVTPHDGHDQVTLLHNLALQLSWKFSRTGLIDELNEAIRIGIDAADAMPHNYPDRANVLSSLAGLLANRYDHVGLMDDLDRAVVLASNAVDAMPQYYSKRGDCLGTLRNLMIRRFERTGSISDLNRAISLASDAVDATPHNHPSLWTHSSSLGQVLMLRYEQTGSTDDLNRAINVGSDAVDRAPREHPQLSLSLSNLGNWLSDRYEKTKVMDDLDRAISVSSDAVDATPHGHPQRAGILSNLGQHLLSRFRQLNSIDDLNRTLSTFMASWECINGSPFARIKSAQMAADILIKQQDWENSFQLLYDATSLLRTMSLRSLHHTDAQALLTSMFGFASSAAAVALRAGKTPGDALCLLELSRGVTASLLMDMREDITEFQSKYPDLAGKLSLLREELDSPARDAPVVAPDKLSSWEIQAKRRREADEEFSKTVDEIRTRPGFSRFLQPPVVEDLMKAADQGPIVVINISSFCGDAFLIQSGSIQVIELPGMTELELYGKAARLQKVDLSSSLEWLWHSICRPCLDALGFTDPVSDGNWPHVWWIPMGFLSQMPLHAAGIYKQASKETVMDRVISSYASSIKALIHGRKRSISKSSQASQNNSALIVAMQDTPGLGQDGHLQFANAEMDMLQGLCPKLSLTPNMPQRCKNDVLEQLPNCKLFHFAGHGRSDPKNPSQSCLLLEDWETNPLTVGAVRDSRLQDNPPFLAYLSACSTGANKVDKLIDEGIQLISAFQLAGFQHVVGTLWEVSDKHCVDVARILYQTLQEEGMTDAAVSRGLHRAVRALRDGVTEKNTQGRDAKLARRKPETQRVQDFLWVPYIHFGV
jgi:tetratricopeptide (TPR) repeat protein